VEVSLIGVGVMGTGMAHNFLRAGRRLTVYDIDSGRMTELLRSGARASASLSAAASGAEVVLLSLPDTTVVRQVAEETLSHMRPGTVLIDLSTSPPSMSRRLAKRAAQADIEFMDAPVSGGQRGAHEGTLSVMVGGKRSTFERVQTLFYDIGAHVYHMGDAGTGQVTKLVNNMMCFTSMWSLVEGLALGTEANVDPNLLREVVSHSSGSTFVWRGGTAAILKDKLDPTFDLRLIKKDLQLALDLANELNVDTPIARNASDLVDRFIELGFVEEDIFATIRHHEEKLNTMIRGRWTPVAEGQ
jgi:3-hydroxyisobutyrate dehydrogenase-like beta-hydroxyacid dehydrogenase